MVAEAPVETSFLKFEEAQRIPGNTTKKHMIHEISRLHGKINTYTPIITKLNISEQRENPHEQNLEDLFNITEL